MTNGVSKEKGIIITKKNVFEELKHFKKEEFNHPESMNESFLRMLDDLRDESGIKMTLIQDFAKKGHVPGSAHYTGEAVDAIPTKDNFLELAKGLYGASVKSKNIIGLGLYPFWKNLKTKEPLPGIHLDNKNRSGQSTFWFRDKDGLYHYSVDFDSVLRAVKALYADALKDTLPKDIKKEDEPIDVEEEVSDTLPKDIKKEDETADA